MKISVAMATYNGEAYIQAQMQSIVKQTKLVDEIVVYDDCSTDKTIDYIRSYQESTTIDIKIFSQSKRMGYIQNFISALREVSGDIIFLCDQDDIWECTKVAEVVQQFHNTNILCIATAFTYMDSNSESIDIPDDGDNHGLCWQSYKQGLLSFISAKELIYHNTAMGCTMAFRSSLKEEYLRKTLQCAAHDWEIYFLAALKQGAVFYNHSFIQYRIHDKNTTGNDKINKRNHVYASEREKNATSLFHFMLALSAYEDEMDAKQRKKRQKLMRLYKKRKIMLCEGRPCLWMYLLKSFREYHKIISIKGMFTDFLYAIKK